MNRVLRYVALVIASIVSLHYVATYTSTSYSNRLSTLRTSWTINPGATNTSDILLNGTDLINLNTSTDSKEQDLIDLIGPYASMPKANATFVVLCRNKELKGILQSIEYLESTFNDRPHHRYPYVFLNDVPFTKWFELRIRRAISSSVEFGLVPKEHWEIPQDIDMAKARKSWLKMQNSGVPYGGSQSYRQMCRFQSGFFFHHPLLQKYKYYWRVEPDVKFMCDITEFDPFRFMQQTNKKYGFTISLHDYPATIRTLWKTTKEWVAENEHMLAKDNLFWFLTDNGGKTYNRCHFWTNFEIADMDFFRSEAYTSFFKHLDKAGGFFYERWGDAPVHSIGAALLLNKTDFHFFDNIGYDHTPILHCPKVPAAKQIAPHTGRLRCQCPHEVSFDFDDGRTSCLYNFIDAIGGDSAQIRKDFYRLDDIV